VLCVVCVCVCIYMCDWVNKRGAGMNKYFGACDVAHQFPACIEANMAAAQMNKLMQKHIHTHTHAYIHT
jgi:hypothetical protein